MNNATESKQSYVKPELVSLGTAQEMTQSINVAASGDQQFSILDS
ncbi:hypothetical protein [Arenimonas sp. MALMAid1274]